MQTMGNRDNQDYGEIIRIKEFETPYQLKILDGPKQSHSIFYPSIDKTTGVPFNVVLQVKNRFDNPLTTLAAMHKSIMAKHLYADKGVNEDTKKEAKKLSSIFEPNSRFHALVLNKWDTVPAVRRVEFAWTINKLILDLEAEVYVDEHGKKNESLLRYGLAFMLWFEIKKVYKDKSKKDRMPEFMNTDYTVRVMEKEAAIFMGKLPSAMKNFSKIEVEDDGVAISFGTKVQRLPVVKLGMFTKEQWDAVRNYEKEIDDFIQPMSDETIMEKLIECPPLVNATRDGKPMVPYFDELLEEFKQKKFSFELQKSEEVLALEQHKKEEEPAEKPKKEAKKVESLDDLLGDVEDAEVVEEKEEKTESLDDLLGDSSDNSSEWPV